MARLSVVVRARPHLLRSAGAVTDLHYAGNPLDKHCCSRKRKYETEIKARHVGREVLAQRHIEKVKAPDRLFPYPCANCRQWHLTKQPQPRTLPMTRVWLIEGVVK